MNGSPGRIRTYDQLVNSQLLYHWATEELGHCRAWLVFVKKIWKIKKVHTIGQVLGISQVVRQRTLTPPSGVRIPHPQPILKYSVFEPLTSFGLTRKPEHWFPPPHPQPILKYSEFSRVRIRLEMRFTHFSSPTKWYSNPCSNYSFCHLRQNSHPQPKYY